MSKLFKLLLIVLAVVIAIIGANSGYHVGKQSRFPVAYSEYIVEYASENDLDPYLVMAVIKVESNFVPEATSAYAGGLMQLTEETAKWVADKLEISDYDFMDPETNIKFGCYYLKHLIDKYEHVDTALAAYNGGMGNVSKWLADSDYSDDGETLKYIPFKETRNYVVKVEKNWEDYKKIYK